MEYRPGNTIDSKMDVSQAYKVEEKKYSVKDLIDEAVNLEKNVSEVYGIFSNAFPEDQDFWWRLSLEEKSHASLIRGVEKLITDGLLPELLHEDYEDLVETNKALTALIQQYRVNPPTRREALEKALELESSAGETHLQDVLTNETNTNYKFPRLMEKFQELHQADVKHAERIIKYMHGLGYDVPQKYLEVLKK